VSEARIEAPRFFEIFDWRLQASLVLLLLIGLMAWDQLNVTLDRWLSPPVEVGPNPAQWTAGSVHPVEITLITGDRDRLACADDREFEGRHCEYTASKMRKPRPSDAPLDDNRVNIIQPYRTAIGNHLVFIAGVWNTPAVAVRHHQEPPQGKADKELKRFATTCQLRFLGSMEDVWARWGPATKWYKEKHAPVAVAESCEIRRSQ